MQLTSWRPFQEMDDLLHRYARRFDTRPPALFDKSGNNITQWSPAADISESNKEYLIKAELPDVDKDDIQVSVKDGALTIDGERKHCEEDENETYHRLESFYGKFSRTFALPANADESRIKADCKNGVLRVHIAKREASDPAKPVNIKVS